MKGVSFASRSRGVILSLYSAWMRGRLEYWYNVLYCQQFA